MTSFTVFHLFRCARLKWLLMTVVCSVKHKYNHYLVVSPKENFPAQFTISQLKLRIKRTWSVGSCGFDLRARRKWPLDPNDLTSSHSIRPKFWNIWANPKLASTLTIHGASNEKAGGQASGCSWTRVFWLRLEDKRAWWPSLSRDAKLYAVIGQGEESTSHTH